MQIVKGNIWDFHKYGEIVCITTNGFIKQNGDAVMGRGTARQAVEKFPKLPTELGLLLGSKGNHVHYLPKYRLITFPVKRTWNEDARLNLIERSCLELVSLADSMCHKSMSLKFKYYLPMPGCGNGNLKWFGEVDKVVEPLLDERFYVVEFSR